MSPDLGVRSTRSPQHAGFTTARIELFVDDPHGRRASFWDAGAYALVMRILYLASSGSSDPTRASIPLHLAVNGSVEIGHEVGLVLAGDATEFLRPDVLEGVEGVGVPPARELMDKAREHRVPIYV